MGRMGTYVTDFLARTRNDFPLTFIEDMNSEDILASANRADVTPLNDDSSPYNPKSCVGLYFNAPVRLPGSCQQLFYHFFPALGTPSGVCLGLSLIHI